MLFFKRRNAVQSHHCLISLAAARGLQSLSASLVLTASCRSRPLLCPDSERKPTANGNPTLTGVKKRGGKKKSSTEARQTRMSEISRIQLLLTVILAPLHRRAVKINYKKKMKCCFWLHLDKLSPSTEHPAHFTKKRLFYFYYFLFLVDAVRRRTSRLNTVQATRKLSFPSWSAVC